MDIVLYGRVPFLSRAAPFDCGLANSSYMSRSVKGDMFVCMVSAVSVCFTRDLAN